MNGFVPVDNDQLLTVSGGSDVPGNGNYGGSGTGSGYASPPPKPKPIQYAPPTGLSRGAPRG